MSSPTKMDSGYVSGDEMPLVEEREESNAETGGGPHVTLAGGPSTIDQIAPETMQQEEKQEEIGNEVSLPIEGGKFTTPMRPIRKSRFVFLSDQKSIPTDIRKLQERTLRRRREFTTYMHDLECRLAAATASFAEEKMDLFAQVAAYSEPNIDKAMWSVSNARESSLPHDKVLDLQRRISKLELDMTKHTHATLFDLKRDELDSRHDQLLQGIIPEMRIESSKSDKIEGGIVRRYEQLAGQLLRQFQEASATRQSSVASLAEKISSAEDQEHQRSDEVLGIIRGLREKLRKEREARRAADRKIMKEIVVQTSAMKRALLES